MCVWLDEGKLDTAVSDGAWPWRARTVLGRS